MPTDLPPDAERVLSRRAASQGVKELAVPLGDGFMQRAGRGSWSVTTSAEGGSEGAPDGGGRMIDLESLEAHFYLMTFDQTPDSHVIKSGSYRVDVTLRAMAGHTIREQPYAAIVLNWQRGKSTITAPCFLAVALTQNVWRVEQYCDGQQSTVAEVRDATLKAGGGFKHVTLEVRGEKLTLIVDKRQLVHSTIPPVGSSARGGAAWRASAALTGSCGLAVFKSRAQVKRFDVSRLEDADANSGGGGALVAARPAFTGGDPKLVELIEGEMLEASPRVSWDAIGGLADAKRLLNEAIVLPLIIPDFFAAASCRSTWKGVLLFGPPGTGKTMLARAVASLGKTAFFNISASSLVSKYHGESEKLARTLFALARHHAPSVVFFDEVDALVSARGMAGEHEASRRLKSELLVQMDGIGSGTAPTADGLVMVLATSNKPWDLDEAMRRRLERRIYVPLPDEASRHEMLRIHLGGVNVSDDVELDTLARASAGYSGADLQLACRDASMMPMRRLVEGKSPHEIVELQASGALDGAVSAQDFTAALGRTQPSTNVAELERYATWNDEFGCK